MALTAEKIANKLKDKEMAQRVLDQLVGFERGNAPKVEYEPQFDSVGDITKGSLGADGLKHYFGLEANENEKDWWER